MNANGRKGDIVIFGKWINANREVSIVLALCAFAAITGGVITWHYPTWLCAFTSAGAAALTFDLCAVVAATVAAWCKGIYERGYRTALIHVQAQAAISEAEATGTETRPN